MEALPLIDYLFHGNALLADSGYPLLILLPETSLAHDLFDILELFFLFIEVKDDL
jgi:hypothetical protein